MNKLGYRRDIGTTRTKTLSYRLVQWEINFRVLLEGDGSPSSGFGDSRNVPGVRNRG